MGLLVALAGWAITTLVFAPASVGIGALVLLVGALGLGVLSAVREGAYAGMAAIFLVAATFFTVGIFLASLGLEELYAFAGVSIFTIQVTRFRAMVRPFLASASRVDRRGLRSVYITFLQRLGFLVILVVLLSLILYTAGTAASFEIPSELAVFLLGIAILIAFLVMARLRTGE
ncbi:MAG: hypothetical protein R3291_02970 [Thermoplasmata archaeon]|nr:hypothetical protein [Thermoplasmata archaeon]